MKIALGIILTTVCAQSFAVEGYKDIYLDREAPVNIHSVFVVKT